MGNREEDLRDLSRALVGKSDAQQRPEISPGCRCGFGAPPNAGQINTQEWKRLKTAGTAGGEGNRSQCETHTHLLGSFNWVSSITRELPSRAKARTLGVS